MFRCDYSLLLNVLQVVGSLVTDHGQAGLDQNPELLPPGEVLLVGARLLQFLQCCLQSCFPFIAVVPVVSFIV